jgi:hypothetical protein
MEFSERTTELIWSYVTFLAERMSCTTASAGQRAIRDGLAILLLQRPFLVLLGGRLDLAYHVSLVGQR